MRLFPLRRLCGVLITSALVACHSKPAPQMTIPPPQPIPRADAAPLPVQPATEAVRVRIWAEPAALPPGGGQVQILVLVQKRDGSPAEGIEARLSSSAGSLYSNGRVLLTDAGGRTRDRLTARGSATVIVNAGGEVERLAIPAR